MAEETIRIIEPLPRQVFQRRGFDIRNSHFNTPDPSALGCADVLVKIAGDALPGSQYEYRLLVDDWCYGVSVDWTPLQLEPKDGFLIGIINIPAGGWYCLQVRCLIDGKQKAVGVVERIGVGEVFIIAGQSNAAGCSEKLLRIKDKSKRASYFDPLRYKWLSGDDPPPLSERRGTIWPPMCDALLPLIRVPIAMVNVSKGATESRQWLPGQELYERFAQAGRLVSDFRAVLWQQGESDVLSNVSAQEYMANLQSIRDGLSDFWGRQVPWLLAKSTLHPVVYSEPQQESVIRGAVDSLCSTPGFLHGPDTDMLGGPENRADMVHGGHFTALGQKRAGQMWAFAIWNAFYERRI